MTKSNTAPVLADLAERTNVEHLPMDSAMVGAANRRDGVMDSCEFAAYAGLSDLSRYGFDRLEPDMRVPNHVRKTIVFIGRATFYSDEALDAYVKACTYDPATLDA